LGSRYTYLFSSCFWLDPKANKNQGPIKGDFCSSKTAVAFYRSMLLSRVWDSWTHLLSFSQIVLIALSSSLPLPANAIPLCAPLSLVMGPASFSRCFLAGFIDVLLSEPLTLPTEAGGVGGVHVM